MRRQEVARAFLPCCSLEEASRLDVEANHTSCSQGPRLLSLLCRLVGLVGWEEGVLILSSLFSGEMCPRRRAGAGEGGGWG